MRTVLPLSEALWKDEDRMSGTLCFRGTRVPVSILFEHLESGLMDEFYSGYPNVTREQIHAVIEASKAMIEQRFKASA